MSQTFAVKDFKSVPDTIRLADDVVALREAEKSGFRFVAEYEMEGVRSKAFRRELKKTIS